MSSALGGAGDNIDDIALHPEPDRASGKIALRIAVDMAEDGLITRWIRVVDEDEELAPPAEGPVV